MTGSPWLVVGLAAIVIVVIAWPLAVLLSSRGRQYGGRGEAPKDRWLTGGMFRGDPRAVSRRDEVPGPDEIPDPGELGPHDALPPEPAEMARRRRQGAGSEEGGHQ
jgi:hypothetical protein